MESNKREGSILHPSNEPEGCGISTIWHTGDGDEMHDACVAHDRLYSAISGEENVPEWLEPDASDEEKELADKIVRLLAQPQTAEIKAKIYELSDKFFYAVMKRKAGRSLFKRAKAYLYYGLARLWSKGR